MNDMLTKSEAMELVSKRLKQMGTPDDPFVVDDAETIVRPFGWVFFYNSKVFLETGAFSYRLAGNGPVIVNKHDGSVEFYGASKPVDVLIAEYESKLG